MPHSNTGNRRSHKPPLHLSPRCELHGSAGVKGGITNFDPSEYEDIIPWLQSITQARLTRLLYILRTTSTLLSRVQAYSRIMVLSVISPWQPAAECLFHIDVLPGV